MQLGELEVGGGGNGAPPLSPTMSQWLPDAPLGDDGGSSEQWRGDRPAPTLGPVPMTQQQVAVQQQHQQRQQQQQLQQDVNQQQLQQQQALLQQQQLLRHLYQQQNQQSQIIAGPTMEMVVGGGQTAQRMVLSPGSQASQDLVWQASSGSLIPGPGEAEQPQQQQLAYLPQLHLSQPPQSQPQQQQQQSYLPQMQLARPQQQLYGGALPSAAVTPHPHQLYAAAQPAPPPMQYAQQPTHLQYAFAPQQYIPAPQQYSTQASGNVDPNSNLDSATLLR